MSRPPPTPTHFPYTTLFRSLSLQLETSTRRLPEASRPVRMRSSFHSATTPERSHGLDRSSGEAVDQLPRSSSEDRKSTRLNSSHLGISYAVFCLKKKNHNNI